METITAERLKELEKIAIDAINTTHSYQSFDPEGFGALQYLSEIEKDKDYGSVTKDILKKPTILDGSQLTIAFWNEQIQPYSSTLKVSVHNLTEPSKDEEYTLTEQHMLKCLYRYYLTILIAIQILHNNKQLKNYTSDCDKEKFLDKGNIKKLKGLGFDFEKIKKHYQAEIFALCEDTQKSKEDEKKSNKHKNNRTVMILLYVLLITIPFALYLHFSNRKTRTPKTETSNNKFDTIKIRDVDQVFLGYKTVTHTTNDGEEITNQYSNVMITVTLKIKSADPESIRASFEEKALGSAINYEVNCEWINASKIGLKISTTSEALCGSFGKTKLGDFFNLVNMRDNNIPLKQIIENEFEHLARAKAASNSVDNAMVVENAKRVRQK